MVSLRPSPSVLVSRRKSDRAQIPRVELTDEQVAELTLCSPLFGERGFLRWCEEHARIKDESTKQNLPFKLFSGQRRVVPDLVAGRWIIALKGRQLGLTWLMVAYVLWRVLYEKRLIIAVVSSEKTYAIEFLDRLKWMHDQLPPWMRLTITKNNEDQVAFRANGKDCRVFSFAGSSKAARSLTCDLAIFDEGSRVDALGEAMIAATPALEVAGGQMVVLSTSAGPHGAFYETWMQNYGEAGELLGEDGVGPTGFVPIFLHWSERPVGGHGTPQRDKAWYAEQEARLRHISPVAVKQEYPETPAEAFEFATGRIYPLFTRERCVGTIDIPEDAVRFRAIDWGGGASADVILWIAYLPGKPGLLVSPDCPNTIREMLAYRWDEDKPDEPLKEDDHTADALRYLCTTARGGLTGLVYVYRELYLPHSVSRGWTLVKLAEAVHTQSGWIEAPPEMKERWIAGRAGEHFELTVADRSNTHAIAQFNQWGIVTTPHVKFKAPAKTDGQSDNERTERIEGIRWVAMLIDGSREIDKKIAVDRTRALAVEAYNTDRKARRRGVRFSVSLSRKMQYKLAREVLRKAG